MSAPIVSDRQKNHYPGNPSAPRFASHHKNPPNAAIPARNRVRSRGRGGAKSASSTAGSLICRAALSLLSSPAPAQQPTQAAQQATQAQIDAIQKACPGDYQTSCGQVPQGPAALNCLKQNMPRETAGCRQALGVLSGGAATPTAPPPGQR
jgi:hypothetical protein